jgi:hypothetical protein
LPEIGTRILFRFVHPSEAESTQVRATSHELAEYAGCLIRLYAIREAERTLARIPDTDPRKYYFQAFARIHEWDYSAALVHLRRYESFAPESPYLSLVARVNLADCLVETGDFSAAAGLLEVLLREARESGAKLLEANVLELTAKNHVYAGDARAAASAIREVKDFFGGRAAGTADAFFLEKLERILELRAGGQGAREALEAFQSRAFGAGEFETARDVDLYRAEFDRDPLIYAKLFHGTPFAAYRRKIVRSAESVGVEIPTEFIAVLGPTGVEDREDDRSIRRPTKAFEPARHFKPRQLLHRLFSALCADLYRPRRLLEVYEKVYPEAIFNPQSSRDQIHQALKRLRQEFADARLPYRVVEEKETYRLEAVRRSPVILREDSPRETHDLARLGDLHQPITSAEAAKRLGCSKNTALAVLNRLVANGELRKEKNGPQTRYADARGQRP